MVLLGPELNGTKRRRKFLCKYAIGWLVEEQDKEQQM